MLDAANELMIQLGLDPSQTSPGDIELASHDKPFSKYPPAGGDDKWPGLPQDAIKNYLHPSKDPLLNTPITPFGLPKDFKAQTGDTQVAWEDGEPWPNKDKSPLDGPQGPAPGIPWVPEAPKAKKGKKTKTMVA